MTPAAIHRYHNEGRRLFEVLEGRLDGREYLCDEYSIADIANWCWDLEPLHDVSGRGRGRQDRRRSPHGLHRARTHGGTRLPFTQAWVRHHDPYDD